MSRTALVLALWCGTVSTVLAKDLCIQFNVGTFAGSHLVLKKVKLGKRTVGAVEGYIAEYTGGDGFSNFMPIHGASLVTKRGNLVLAITVHPVRSDTLGGTSVSIQPSSAMNYACGAGADEKIGELDTCGGSIGGVVATGHVVTCSDVDAIPD